MTDLPSDNQGNTIQALRLGPTAQKISFTATTARNPNPFTSNVRVVYLYATQDCFVKFGIDTTVTATTNDFFIPSGTMLPFAIRTDQGPSFNYIAAIQSTAAGILYISELF